jgi:predicted DNA-binding transcriptional regulator YafY
MQVTLPMIIKQELEAAILQYGKDVEVVAPLHLRTKISEILKEAVTFFQ